MKRSFKILKVLFVAIIAFTLTGCVKFNATMEISKNGKINYNILYLKVYLQMKIRRI